MTHHVHQSMGSMLQVIRMTHHDTPWHTMTHQSMGSMLQVTRPLLVSRTTLVCHVRRARHALVTRARSMLQVTSDTSTHTSRGVGDERPLLVSNQGRDGVSWVSWDVIGCHWDVPSCRTRDGMLGRLPTRQRSVPLWRRRTHSSTLLEPSARQRGGASRARRSLACASVVRHHLSPPPSTYLSTYLSTSLNSNE